MSGVVILTPIIVTTAWPVIASVSGAIMTSLGYTLLDTAVTSREEEQSTENSVELEIAAAGEVAATLGREETLSYTNGEVEVKFSRDVRGRMRVCVSGEGHSKRELSTLGRELAGRVVQQYVYERITAEAKNQTGMEIVDQSVDEDNNIRITLRSWED